MINTSLIRPINGSWFSIYWKDGRHSYWNDACLKYSAQEWDLVIKEMAELGMEYLVFCNVASWGQAVYDSKVLPKIQMGCDDPIEMVMTACDKYGMKIFMTNDYFMDENYFKRDEMFLPEVKAGRYKMMEELAEKYSHHESFYGWYWAWEAHISPYFADHFFKYVNESTALARTLTPNAKYLTAPYGTKFATYDDKFLKQLDMLDVDIIAYQDTIGCLAMDIEQSARSFEILRKVHDKVPQRKLWADIETFAWKGEPNVCDTPLIPAPFERLLGQLEAVSPYVDEILTFIFQGLFSNKNYSTYTGHIEAAENYDNYVNWLKQNHPNMFKKF